MSHKYSKRTGKLNTEKATATLLFNGLALFYFTPQGRYEGQILRRRDHLFYLKITEIGPHGPSGEIDVTRYLDINSNIDIEVIHPAKKGLYRYEQGSFDPRMEGNDKNDFRWIVDMEGSKFHKRRLHKKPKGTTTRGGAVKTRLQRLRISDATFYTHEQSYERYARERLDQPSEPGLFIGKIAHVIGMDITCQNKSGSGIRLTNPDSNGKGLFLPRRDDVRYEIDIYNVCPEMISEEKPSDFVLYYEVVEDSSKVKYDLVRAVHIDDPRARKPLVKLMDFEGWALDSHLIMCDKVYLSQTSVWR